MGAVEARGRLAQHMAVAVAAAKVEPRFDPAVDRQERAVGGSVSGFTEELDLQAAKRLAATLLFCQAVADRARGSR